MISIQTEENIKYMNPWTNAEKALVSRRLPAETGWTLCSSGSCFSRGQSVAGWTRSPSWRECGDELWSGWRYLAHSLQEGETYMISGEEREGPSGVLISSTATLFTAREGICLEWKYFYFKCSARERLSNGSAHQHTDEMLVQLTLSFHQCVKEQKEVCPSVPQMSAFITKVWQWWLCLSLGAWW